MIIYVYTLEDMSMYIYIYTLWYIMYDDICINMLNIQSQICARHRGRQLIAKEALLRNESRVLWGVSDVSGYGHGCGQLG